MLIPKPKKIKCKKCKKEFLITIGDVRPQEVVCPHCKYSWLIDK